MPKEKKTDNVTELAQRLIAEIKANRPRSGGKAAVAGPGARQQHSEDTS